MLNESLLKLCFALRQLEIEFFLKRTPHFTYLTMTKMVKNGSRSNSLIDSSHSIDIRRKIYFLDCKKVVTQKALSTRDETHLPYLQHSLITFIRKFSLSL